MKYVHSFVYSSIKTLKIFWYQHTLLVAYLSHLPVDNKFNLHTNHLVCLFFETVDFVTLSVEICPPKCHQGGAVAGEVEVPTRGQRQVPGPGSTARLGQGLGSCNASQN